MTDTPSNLRTKIAEIICDAAHYDEDEVNLLPFADAILAIPEIAEALDMRAAMFRVIEAGTPSPLEELFYGYNG